MGVLQPTMGNLHLWEGQAGRWQEGGRGGEEEEEGECGLEKGKCGWKRKARKLGR